MPLASATVSDFIRVLLDREPDGADEIAELARLCPDVPALRRHLIASEEFERRNPELARSNTTAPVIVTLDDDVRVVVDLADHAVGVPIARRRFELNEREFVRGTVREGQYVVDGGAHVGYHALSMARLVGPRGRVVAFEPIAATAERLQLGVAENLFEGIVSIERAALAASNGWGEMIEPAGNPAASYLRLGGARVPRGSTASPVRTAALDECVLPRPLHFVRLDVEGAEGLAILGAMRVLREDRPVLLVEIHADLLDSVSGTRPAELRERLRLLGYRCHALGAGVPGPELTDLPSSGVHSIVFLP